MGIKENIADINLQKDTYARKSGRSGDDVLLIGVTKNRTPEEMNQAISMGITDIGENRVQELLDKYDRIEKNVRWHLIGHLQRNKVKYIIDKVYMIHSVDSKLAQEINSRAGQAGVIANILIQINAAEETCKFGISKDDVEQLLTEILENCEYIQVRGLMHIAPFAENPEDVREYFRDVNDLYKQFSQIKHERANFTTLSMGMSNDFGVAIEEGSNAIRVGTSIFGSRDYTK